MRLPDHRRESPQHCLLLGLLPGLQEPCTCRFYSWIFFFFFEARIITTVKIDEAMGYEELRLTKTKLICQGRLQIFVNVFVVLALEQLG